MPVRHPGIRVFLSLVLSVLATTMSCADPTAYAVRGSGGTVWAIGDQPGTEFVAFTFTDLLPQRTGGPTPGPRITFSLTRWSLEAGGFVRRQWYGDVPFKVESLRIGSDLTDASFEADVMGSLEERTAAGTMVRRDVPGRLQLRWSPGGNRGVVTASFIYQTPPYLVTLTSSGQGRSASTVATVTVAALGGTHNVAGFGSLTNPTSGNLVVTMQ